MFRNILPAIAALGVAASAAQAALVIDVRAVSATGGAIVNGDKSVTAPTGTGVVNLQIWGTVSGADANTANDGLQIALGSLRSSNGGLKGDLTHALNSSFNTSSFANAGTRQDVDGDGDLDVGSTGATNTTANWIYYFSSSMQAGNSFLLGTGTFTLTGNSGSTDINFFRRAASNSNDAAWREDAVNKNTGTSGAAAGTLSFGAPVNVVVPEPATVGLVGLAGAAVLGRRRRTA